MLVAVSNGVYCLFLAEIQLASNDENQIHRYFEVKQYTIYTNCRFFDGIDWNSKSKTNYMVTFQEWCWAFHDVKQWQEYGHHVSCHPGRRCITMHIEVHKHVLIDNRANLCINLQSQNYFEIKTLDIPPLKVEERTQSMIEEIKGMNLLWTVSNGLFLSSFSSVINTLDQLVCRALGTPPAQVRSPARANLLVGGGAVYLRVKKKTLACPTSKHRSKAGPVSQGLQCCRVRVGWGFGGFLNLCEDVFVLQHNVVRVLLPPQVEFF